MRNHKNKKKNHTYLSRAIQKWGWKNFRREIVVTAPVADLNRLEMEYIERERTFLDPRHYNLTAGGEGTCGYNHTQDTKKKMRERKTDRSVCGCVSFNKQRKLWWAKVRQTGVQITIGRYATKNEAEDALVVFSETGQKLPSPGAKKRINGAGSISEVKTGKKKKFKARFHVEGKRKSKTFETIGEAQDFLESYANKKTKIE
jgi:group I intron endonuclease